MNVNLYNRRELRSEFNDNGSDNGGGQESVDDIWEEDPVDGEEQESETPETPVSQAPSFDPNEFSRQLASSIAPYVAPKPQSEQKREMTAEEFRQATKYYAIKKDHVTKLFSPDTPEEEKVLALQELIDGASTHAVNVANLLLQERYGKLETQMNSSLTPLKQERETKNRNEFVSTLESSHSAFKGKTKAIHMAIDHMMQSNYQTQGPDADRKNILLTAASIIKQFDPSFSIKPNPNPANRANQRKPAGAVNSGASGGSRGNKTQVKPEDAIWQ